MQYVMYVPIDANTTEPGTLSSFCNTYFEHAADFWSASAPEILHNFITRLTTCFEEVVLGEAEAEEEAEEEGGR